MVECNQGYFTSYLIKKNSQKIIWPYQASIVQKIRMVYNQLLKGQYFLQSYFVHKFSKEKNGKLCQWDRDAPATRNRSTTPKREKVQNPTSLGGS